MDQEKQKKTLIMVAYYGVILLGIYLGCHFLLPPLMPFILGFLAAWILHRPAAFLSAKFHVPQKILAILLTALFYFLTATVIIFAGAQFISALSDVLPRLPEIYTNQLLPFLDNCIDEIKAFAAQIDPSIVDEIDTLAGNVSASVMQMITAFSGSMVKFISGIATGMPVLIVKIVLTIVSTFFISMDFDRVVGFLKKMLPEKAAKAIHPIKEKTLHSLKIFVRSYCLIFLMTFTELSVGFLLMRIPYAFWIGLLVAIVDIMPVLGTGLVLLPWALIAALLKKIPIAIGMALLYVLITAIRNTVEPRLVGRQIGLHPLATLISMFLGMHFFGIVGLFVFPVALSLLVQFERDGVLPLPFWIIRRTQEKS